MSSDDPEADFASLVRLRKAKVEEKLKELGDGLKEKYESVEEFHAASDIIESAQLPDGSGVMLGSFPLPPDHWSKQTSLPLPVSFIDDPRKGLRAKLLEGGRYAYVVSGIGSQKDHDPDAFLQNLVVGVMGYQAPLHMGRDAFSPPKDEVNHPAHYRAGTGVEAIDAIEAWGLGFCTGNVVKYIARAGHKGDPIGDLKKARWHLDREITALEKLADQDV